VRDEKFKVKAGVDTKLETAANALLKRDAAISVAFPPIEKVFAHGCGLISPCHCKQWVLITEAEQSVRLGQAHWLSDLILGMPNPPKLPSEKTYKAIVYLRGSRFPQARVSGAPHITAVTVFGHEHRERQERLKHAESSENEKLVRVVEIWPEYKDLELENDECCVWFNLKPYRTIDAELLNELARELDKSADEVEHLFDQAEEKIQKYHRRLIAHKTGIYGVWKNIPADFNLLPAGRMSRTLMILTKAISTPEFGRLTSDQQIAIRVYVDARLNFRNAARRAKAPENTIRDRVQGGFASLGRIRAEGNLSKEFKAIQNTLFGCDVRDTIRSAQDREEALEVKDILATGGAPMGSRIVGRGTRIGAGGRQMQKRLDTLENSQYTIHEAERAEGDKDNKDRGGHEVDFDDHSENSLR
jgi:hypothetical protein